MSEQCQTCVRRKLECDMFRPRCSPCRKSHVKCVYEPAHPIIAFHDETEQVKARSSQPPKRRRTPSTPIVDEPVGSFDNQHGNDYGQINHAGERSALAEDWLFFADEDAPTFDPAMLSWASELFEHNLGQALAYPPSGPANAQVPNSETSCLGSVSWTTPLGDAPAPQIPSGVAPASSTSPSQAHAGSPSEVSDHVLAQHYTRNLTGRYSSKDPAWNYYVHFYNRFNASHPFVLSSLYAWTSAHMFCNKTVDSTATVFSHYQKCLEGIEQRYNVNLCGYEPQQEQPFRALIHVSDDDFDAICVAIYFLASADLVLSLPSRLHRILDIEAALLDCRTKEPKKLSVTIAIWFCYLDARVSSFGLGSVRIIQAVGGETGLLQATVRTKSLLEKEYSPIYPHKEQQRDEKHLPLLTATNRLVAVYGHISQHYGTLDHPELPRIRASLDDIYKVLSATTETYAAEKKVLSTFLTTTALYHCVEIYFSRSFEPEEPLYSADHHASKIITITDKMYRVLSLPITEPPPTKMWPIPLTMAAIEAKDPVYRSWAIQKIKAYSNAGEYFSKSCQFAEKVQVAEEESGCRADLADLARSMGDDFII